MIKNLKEIQKVTVRRAKQLRGEIHIPADKSIAHRTMFLNVFTDGEAEITNYLEGIDTLGTIRCLKSLGVDIVHEYGKRVIIKGIGDAKLQESNEILNVGTSATTMRFLCGLLASQPIYTVVTGVPRTNDRPMKRVIEPLTEMGAHIWGRKDNTTGPLAIRGGDLKGIQYKSEVSSSEVKTCLLLAGLKSKEGFTSIESKYPTRDHTERMLRAMGHEVISEDNGRIVKIAPLHKPLKPLSMFVPGEISAAVYWIVVGLVHPDSDITIKDVCINHLRTGLLDVLKKMGGDIEIFERHELSQIESIGDIRVRSSRLKGITVEPEYFTRMIDEFPGFALAASLAEGTTVIKGVQDLRNKKSNRIACVVDEFTKLGANVVETEDGMLFEGVECLKGNQCTSHGDHRLGNSLIISGLVADGETTIDDVLPVTSTSYPDFWEQVKKVCNNDVIVNAE